MLAVALDAAVWFLSDGLPELPGQRLSAPIYDAVFRRRSNLPFDFYNVEGQAGRRLGAPKKNHFYAAGQTKSPAFAPRVSGSDRTRH